MKKKLFYSVAIAATMASCSQEAIEVPSNNMQDLSVRPVLGEVVLAEDVNVASRFAAGAGARPEFSENDQIGAAIMDAPLYPAKPYDEANKAENYSIVEYYSSNSAFTKDGGAWYLNEDQPLVEGNYLFYAPYNQSMQLRTPFEVRVPQRQTADTEKAALNEYYASGAVVRVGHNFLAANNGVAQRPSVKFFDVMSYPKFTIENNFDGYTVSLPNEDGDITIAEYNGAIKVDSIQFIYKNETGKGVVIGGLLSNAKVASSLKSWLRDLRNNETKDLLNADATIETYSTITTLAAGGREIAQGEKAVFYAVMPAVQFAAGELNANVYVTIGEKPYVISSADITLTIDEEEETTSLEANNVAAGHTYATSTGTITMLPGQSYPQEELNYENGQFTAKAIYGRALTLKLEGGKVEEAGTEEGLQVAKEISLDENEKEDATSTDLIDNNEEFIQFFKDMESGSHLTENEEAEIDYENAKFAFSENTTATINSELINALADYTYRGSISIDKSLVIANDVKVSNVTGNKVEFTSNTGLKYAITLGEGYSVNDGIVISTGKSVHVKSGSTWNVPATTTIGNIRNDGTMNVGTRLTATTLVNNNILNLNASANIINAFTNNAIVWVNNQNAIATIGAGIGNIHINSSVQTASNLTIKYVIVTGGNQIGHFHAAVADVASVENAEKISWVKEFHTTASVNFATTDLLSKVVDINTIHLAGASFNDVKTFDMKNVTLNFGSNNVTITGTSVSQTIVENLKIKNTGRVVFQDIAASGSQTGSGELYADGITATWNGEAVGVEALVVDNLTQTYTVNTRSGLKQIANIVNAGNTLEGWTVKLANDLDLTNFAMTSIGNKENPFNGTFDGNGKTIFNLNLTGIANVGLIGRGYPGATIKNVTIDGAKVVGNHYVAALCGYIYGNISNCKVLNSEIICVAGNGEDGDKASALVGLLPADNKGKIENCQAVDCTISASRDAGQIVGAGKVEKVVNCTAENVKVSANGTGTDSKVGQNINDDLVGSKL